MKKDMGQRIRARRELLGYTRENLAERLGVSTKFCSDIELGVKGMSIETLCKLSKELMVTTAYILFGKGCDDNDEIMHLVSMCNQDKLPYLKNIICNFAGAVGE